MSFILCIETGTSTCSVSLGQKGRVIDVEESHDPENSHAKNTTVFIDSILKRQSLRVKDLGAVCVSKGPGSYTGLRIGVSVAKGICYGSGIPLLAVGSLQAMAHGAMEMIKDGKQQSIPSMLCPMIDARRMEVYSQLFSANAEALTGVEAKVLDANSFSDYLTENKILFFGNGSEKAKEVITLPNALFLDGFNPSARFMIHLAEKLYNQNKFEDVAYFEPFYLKNFVATVAKNKVLGQK
ncbi:MAG: tRNA (adenosine(37)-N6)-threonylcarbamoyltransferase complex dimerization subunit type 1 TsaB [Bacteroidales bacterium]|nr:tRNA (adenosine(37)-N6)-threonylcarbamoyltransferase complex dimerization subunit type 1 TsaB [Bacteroidales bacterium]MDD3890734.1 tRNA (adenosine(37)-N6)-threonylcarbamoyltransferase complex dimerization subunit type 1 TsaB [Bacteroidales bacterium]